MGWRQFDGEDLAAVREVLDSGNLCSIGGTQVPAFEREFAAELGAPCGLGVVNAMAGLHCAVADAGGGHGDQALVDSVASFAAPAARTRCISVSISSPSRRRDCRCT